MLYGEFDHNLDSKGRMNFPAKMREEMGPVFVITRWTDSCLAAFSMKEWEKLSEKLSGIKLAEGRDIVRYIFSNACEVEPDKQGRILIPQKLREKAGLVKDVTVIGVMNRAEIWDTENWNKVSSTLDSTSFEERLEALGL